jgi:hypothetical protein
MPVGPIAVLCLTRTAVLGNRFLGVAEARKRADISGADAPDGTAAATRTSDGSELLHIAIKRDGTFAAVARPNLYGDIVEKHADGV